jgi:5-methyltetrahydropteroyltriglutamate--homocysteine methyltransferase
LPSGGWCRTAPRSPPSFQLDEPWLQASSEEARRLALPAINRALEGIPGPTALHLCFGYAYVARDKPNRYAFLPELAGSRVDQISIEAAQPNLDLTTLDDRAPAARAADSGPDCGMKYIPRDLAFAKLKALAEGAAIVRRELTGG